MKTLLILIVLSSCATYRASRQQLKANRIEWEAKDSINQQIRFGHVIKRNQSKIKHNGNVHPSGKLIALSLIAIACLSVR